MIFFVLNMAIVWLDFLFVFFVVSLLCLENLTVYIQLIQAGVRRNCKNLRLKY